MRINHIERAMDEDELRLRTAIDHALERVASDEGYDLEEVWDTVERMLSGAFEAVH